MLMHEHLNLWQRFNTIGGQPFGSKFVGKVDLQRVGTLGHSFGGEGVIEHLFLNREMGSRYSVKAVVAVAPTNQRRRIVNDVPLAVIVSYCDADVGTGPPVRYYDDARYNKPGDTAAKHLILMRGANHNFYNAIWTPTIFRPSNDDSSQSGDSACSPGSPGRMSDGEQRAAALAYVVSFFRVYIGGESALLPFITGDARPPAVAAQKVLVSYHPPDNSIQRRDVSRFLNQGALTTNDLGGTAVANGLTPYTVCGSSSNCLPRVSQPHTSVEGGLSQLLIGWDSASASYTQELPAGQRDVREFKALQFRAAIAFTDSRNAENASQDFSLTLIDGAGRTSSTNVGQFSAALTYPPGNDSRKLLLNAIRVPLNAFAGVSLEDIRTIRFNFNRNPSGSILITDLAFTDGALVDPNQPDFSISLDVPTVNTQRGRKVKVVVNLTRTNGFNGRVTVTPPDTSAINVKANPVNPIETNQASVKFKLKLKSSAQRGTHQLNFIARDDQGRVRAASLTLVVD